MAEFKLVVSDPKTGKAYKKELKGAEAGTLVGKKLGDKVDGGKIGLAGFELELTGGSDKSGFPMRESFHGARIAPLLLTGGQGFNPERKGQRRKKRVRGDTVTEQISQINLKVVSGSGKLEKLLGVEAKADGEKKEEKSEAKPVEAKKEVEAKPAEKKEEAPKEAPSK